MTDYQWRPGTLALVNARWTTGHPTSEALAVRRERGWERIYDSAWAREGEAPRARPVVVIDPEATELVIHLVSLWGETGDMQDALREYARPAPRLEEPQGLGAVVVDESDRKFVRRCACGSTHDWWAVGAITSAPGLSWSDLNAVRILSPGVTP